MKVVLGITRARLMGSGYYEMVPLPGDSIEVEIEDDEYLHSVWMTADGQEILHLPLAVVPATLREPTIT